MGTEKRKHMHQDEKYKWILEVCGEEYSRYSREYEGDIINRIIRTGVVNGITSRLEAEYIKRRDSQEIKNEN